MLTTVLYAVRKCLNFDHRNILCSPDILRCLFNGHLHDTERTTDEGIDDMTINVFSNETPDLSVTGTYAEAGLGWTVDIDGKTGATLIEQCTIR